MTFIHPTAVVEDGAVLGVGAKVWHFAHVRSGAQIGADTQLGKSCYVDDKVVIGNRCKIQNFVSVYAGVTLEDEVFVGPSAVFTNDMYPRATGSWEVTHTLVRRGASLGANCTLVCGVEVGEYAMVAAGSVVTKSVAAYELVAGVPAHRIGFVCRCGRPVAHRTPICSHGA